jgi:hypothetical protein
MTLQDLGNLGEFIGSMGVVITLIYLARQSVAHSYQSCDRPAVARGGIRPNS